MNKNAVLQVTFSILTKIIQIPLFFKTTKKACLQAGKNVISTAGNQGTFLC